MKDRTHRVDLCVVGGGLAGLCAAVAAARHGARVALMHDRPVLGGNASSEIRMHVCGAHGRNNLATGIIEEIQLENLYRNPNASWSLWDSVLYEKARFQENLMLLLNCSCNGLRMDGARIQSVRGWQLTSETWHTVEATLFADCSGDSILAPLSGAEFRIGREAASEFNEDIEPPAADSKTMGMSCLIQARETGRFQEFIPPSWANKYPFDDDLPHRSHDVRSTNFWWLELGGEADVVHDTEETRDELLKVAFGVWDHVKNHGDHGAENWVLDWVGFLPGKRESRRYIGDHVLTQNDVRAEGRFDDLAAFGGWTMDDHHPGGIRWPGKPTIFHPAPSPYGIPYRCLYSRNIENLLFAGRNISATHAALSSSRVMATCAILGQAAGTAAAIAVRDGLTPRGVYRDRIHMLQQTLMDDDCYLPWHIREMPELTRRARLAASEGYPEPLRNGIDRPVGEEHVGAAENSWAGAPGSWVAYSWSAPQKISQLRFIFDSDLNRGSAHNPRHFTNMPFRYPLDGKPMSVPASMIRAFRVEARDGDGPWTVIAREGNNHQRLVRLKVDAAASEIRFSPESTRGASSCRFFAWDVR